MRDFLSGDEVKTQERKSKKSVSYEGRVNAKLQATAEVLRGMAKPTPGPWKVVMDRQSDKMRIETWDERIIAYVPAHSAASFANARAISKLPELINAAWEVIGRWEHGDLAGAVRELNRAVDEATGG